MPRKRSETVELLEEALTQAAVVRDRLRRAMEARGISHREMDRRLGYAEGLVSRMLAGSRPFQVHELIAMARILEVQPHELFLEPGLAAEAGRPFPIPEDQWTALVESTLRKLGYGRESVTPPADETEPAYKPSR